MENYFEKYTRRKIHEKIYQTVTETIFRIYMKIAYSATIINFLSFSLPFCLSRAFM